MGSEASTARATRSMADPGAEKVAEKGHVGPLSSVDLPGYQPLEDRSHLRLGITMVGAFRFLEETGFLCQKYKFSPPAYTSSWHDWLYVDTYVRPESFAWLNESYELSKGDNYHTFHYGLRNMTGYDLCAHIRTWLKDNQCEGLSVCEVVLVDKRFAHLREHVGLARVFHSHPQVEGWLGNLGTAEWVQKCEIHPLGLRFLPRAKERYFWLDYFCLRQAKASDFEPHAIVRLIKEIGMFTCGMFDDMKYFKRSFCLMEFFAAYAGGAQIISYFIGALMKDQVLKDMQSRPIDSAVAQTRKPEDKQLIDGFILEEFKSDGFQGFDRVITKILVEQMDARWR